MRSQTVRNAARFGSVAALFAVTLVSTQAYAGDVETAPSGGVYSSVGAASLNYEHMNGLPTSIETGYIGPAIAQVNVGVRIDPVDKGGPLFSVDMPRGALVEASWGNNQQIVLRAQNGSETDGLVKVRHTLTPAINFKFDGFGFQANLTYNANDLLKYIPGSKFFYDSQAQQSFAPWGFTAVETKLNAPVRADAKLFEMDFDKTPKFISDNVKGTFGVLALTKPTFTYHTTKIMLSGTEGELTNGSDEVTVPAVDGDFMEIMAAVEGEMAVKGAITIEPFVYLAQLGSNLALETELSIPVFSVDYTAPETKVNFQTVLVHIPMPNVRVPTKGLDIGMVKVGGQATKTVEIKNSGELAASMTFASSDPQFRVPSGMISIPPKGSYELVVKFSPESASPASAEITVMSNDADSPKQMFQVGANGADVGDSDRAAGLPGDDADLDAGGCGCKAAGSSSPVPGWAGIGLAGLGAVVFFRRRRTAA